MRKKPFFIVLFPEFFRILSKIFSEFWPKNFKNLWKLTSPCPQEQLVALNFFLKVLNRFGLSAETFGMVLKFLSTCPDENLRKKYFFYCSFLIFFRILSEKLFRVLAKKLQEFVKTTFYVSREQFVAWFFLSFETFRIFCRNIWHGSQNSIYVSRVKIAEKKPFFLFSFQNFFGFWAKTFQSFGQKTSRICKNYLLRVQRNNLWLDFF